MSDTEGLTEVSINFDFGSEIEKPRLVSLLFFDFANQTSDGKVNLSGIFDRLLVSPETKKTVPIGIFVRTARTYDSPVTVSIISPGKKPVGGFAFTMTRQEREAQGGKGDGMMQILARVQFDAPSEGEYWFAVGFDGQTIGGCPLLVEFREKEIGEEITRGDA